MKASNDSKKAIKEFLDKRASEDELFAITYKKENKNLDECWNYIMQRAKKGGCNMYSNEEVFEWAIHYYDEDDIKDIKPVAGYSTVSSSSSKKETTKKEEKEPKKALKKKEDSSNQTSLF